MKHILILSMIICNACYGQRMERFDSAMEIMQDSNWATMSFGGTITTSIFDSITIKEDGVRKYRKRDTVEVILLVTSDTGPIAFRMEAYSVRELHNTSEGVLDAGGQMCIGTNGQVIDCWHDYYQHLYYIDKNKLPLSKNIIVWQSKEIQ